MSEFHSGASTPPAAGGLSAAPLPRSFYLRGAEPVARELLGAILVHRVGRQCHRARIVETEAYVGSHDLACHAARGRTRRTEVMFMPGGHAYVYLIYGMYQMFNVVTSVADDPQAVLVRAAEPLDGWKADLSGPGKLTRAMQITAGDNRRDLTADKLYLLPNPGHRVRIAVSRRVGVDYAREWAHAMLRFCDMTSRAVSRPRPAEEG